MCTYPYRYGNQTVDPMRALVVVYSYPEARLPISCMGYCFRDPYILPMFNLLEPSESTIWETGLLGLLAIVDNVCSRAGLLLAALGP